MEAGCLQVQLRHHSVLALSNLPIPGRDHRKRPCCTHSSGPRSWSAAGRGARCAAEVSLEAEGLSQVPEAVQTIAVVAQGIRVELDLGLGQLVRVETTWDGRVVAPFHRAPWADVPGPIPGTLDAPHLARLSGDFFCAPFATADVEAAPPHGWPANSPWRPLDVEHFEGGTRARFVLGKSVLGARVTKELTVRDGHPFLYQRHVFAHGRGGIPVANHAMVSLPGGGRLSFSAKRWAESPAAPLETDPARGRSMLAYPSRTPDLASFPTAVGETVDLTRYPLGEAHEDFVVLVEADESPLGWTAVRRPEGDLALMLKNPAELPVTMLWFSNGGRYYAPWNGRHQRVLGVEDGCTFLAEGHSASINSNSWSMAGIPTAIQLEPDGTVDVRHVIGAVPVDRTFGPVRDVRTETGALVVEDASGAVLRFPFDEAFLFPVL
jgi:hypothetical protein